MSEPPIVRLGQLPADRLADLVAESGAAGLRFLRRLVADWEGGLNRFDRAGEALFAALEGGRVIGVCGLNADPYAPGSGAGRLRHLYVHSSFRRQGIGRRLVGAVVASARGWFRVLRLRTNSEGAARFYERLGFRACTGVPDCTHLLDLTAG
jgi:GNAT superfamily N-acetyltransferase